MCPGYTVGSPHPDEHETIDPAMWRRVDLQLADAEHGTVRVALLRPIEWLHAIGLREGGEFEIHLQELGISGCARVVAIGPCPEIQKAPPGSQIVTGTFVTERAEILQVWLDGAGKPLGTTAAHPFYSDDRSAWVPAGELRTGEAVRTLTGKTTVERVERPGTQATVYNLEVHRAHTYFAGESRAWVHNECIGVGGSVLRVERRSDHLFVRVHFLELAKDIPGLFSRVREIARNAGTIGKVIVESGHVVNDDLLRKLLKLSEAGGRFFGGIVHRTGDRTFTIIFESAL